MAKAKKTAAASTSVAIELPPLKIETMEVTIIGDTPLIVHAWSQKAKKEMLAKQMKAPAEAKEAKDPEQDFRDSLYRLEAVGARGGDRFGIPSVALKCAAVTACTSVANITKVEARQAFHVTGEMTWIDGAFPGLKMRQDLVQIFGGKPQMREDMVRVGMGTADLRYRGEFFPWWCTVKVRFNGRLLSPAQIVNLFNIAGFAVGVCEWRPEKDGQSGMFHVATTQELKSLIRRVA